MPETSDKLTHKTWLRHATMVIAVSGLAVFAVSCAPAPPPPPPPQPVAQQYPPPPPPMPRPMRPGSPVGPQYGERG